MKHISILIALCILAVPVIGEDISIQYHPDMQAHEVIGPMNAVSDLNAYTLSGAALLTVVYDNGTKLYMIRTLLRYIAPTPYVFSIYTVDADAGIGLMRNCDVQAMSAGGRIIYQEIGAINVTEEFIAKHKDTGIGIVLLSRMTRSHTVSLTIPSDMIQKHLAAVKKVEMKSK